MRCEVSRGESDVGSAIGVASPTSTASWALRRLFFCSFPKFTFLAFRRRPAFHPGIALTGILGQLAPRAFGYDRRLPFLLLHERHGASQLHGGAVIQNLCLVTTGNGTGRKRTDRSVAHR